MNSQSLYRSASILAILISIVVILVYAKPFLIPIAFAAILSMLLLPVTKWLNAKGVNNIISIILSILLLVAFVTLLIFLLSRQVGDMANDFPKIKERATGIYEQVKNFITQHLGISESKLEQKVKENQSSSQGQMGSGIAGIMGGIGSLLTNFILVLVYIFLLIFFRGRLKAFVIRVVPKKEQKNAETIIDKAQKVAQKYLTGLFMMIVCLWVMYSIGFAIAGVEKPIFFAVICGVLEIVPFIGNITGTALTIFVSLVQGAGTNVMIGILITYALVQFIQTYILEPLVVGAEVNINPLFTILCIVAGESLWGIAGMVLAIPILGIIKIVCDHVEALKPFGYLIGQDKKNQDSPFDKLMKKIKGKK